MKKTSDNLYFDKVPSNGGRPSMVLNDKGKEAVFMLSKILCTDEEIADILGTTPDTLHNAKNVEAFSEQKKRGQSEGKASLRRTAFQMSGKSAAMCIFLLKNFLGLRDNPEPLGDANELLNALLEAYRSNNDKTVSVTE